jgi:outer membrane usher protein
MRALTAAAIATRAPRTLSRSFVPRAALAVALAFALAGNALALPGDEPLLLDICINDHCIGVAAVIARGDDVLVDRAALETAGLDTAGTTSERLGERDFISLHQLNHGSTFALDRTLLRLDLHLRADRLPRQRMTMATRPQMEAGLQPWTAFLNYGASAANKGDRQLFVDGAIGHGNGALRTNAQWTTFDGWKRGLSRFEFDQPEGRRRWTVGDQYATPRDPLGGGRLLGGVGVERAFDTDPYLVTFPQPYYSGVLETPGTVEVYANGTLIGRRDVGAGPFTLEQLGIQPGRNDVRVIVRDPFGNRSELATRNYYGGTPRLLAKGLSEYAARVGAPRTGGGLGGHYEGDAAWQGWYRRGVTDSITLGGRAEGDEFVRNAGLDAAVTTPVGEFAFAVAGSDADGLGRANAHAINYSLNLHAMSLGLGSRRAQTGYRNFDDPTARLLGALRVDDYASVSIAPPGRVTLQFNAGRQQRERAPEERSYGMTGSVRLWDRGQLFATAQRIESDLFRDTSVQLSLSIALDRDSINISSRHAETNDVAHDGYAIDARRSRPPGSGWGYAASVRQDDAFDSAYGMLEYQGTHGRIAVEGNSFGNHQSVNVLASGGLVAIGGRVFATPPVESGFALVRVPGLANVPILRENQMVGRTDARGDLLVRELLPFQANKIGLDAARVPAGYDLRTPQRNLWVPRNTGAVVLLDAPAVRAVKGRFHYAGQAAGDLAHLARDDEGAPIGNDGLFYFDGIPAGRHVATIQREGDTVQCTLDVPVQSKPGVTDLGDVTCEAAR